MVASADARIALAKSFACQCKMAVSQIRPMPRWAPTVRMVECLVVVSNR
jgi:hypothetical protein